ncbi:unnamed protein product [Paramecium octaurelia]|uniref:Uncharacterized protein n=1 Tax=Paramecium octaurelia TaxID=43137 RepID=A0A8S1X8R6_PAROT|nr:unnamed protein product [Paramecium octaurelia]
MQEKINEELFQGQSATFLSYYLTQSLPDLLRLIQDPSQGLRRSLQTYSNVGQEKVKNFLKQHKRYLSRMGLITQQPDDFQSWFEFQEKKGIGKILKDTRENIDKPGVKSKFENQQQQPLGSKKAQVQAQSRNNKWEKNDKRRAFSNTVFGLYTKSKITQEHQILQSPYTTPTFQIQFMIKILFLNINGGRLYQFYGYQLIIQYHLTLIILRFIFLIPFYYTKLTINALRYLQFHLKQEDVYKNKVCKNLY